MLLSEQLETYNPEQLITEGKLPGEHEHGSHTIALTRVRVSPAGGVWYTVKANRDGRYSAEFEVAVTPQVKRGGPAYIVSLMYTNYKAEWIVTKNNKLLSGDAVLRISGFAGPVPVTDLVGTLVKHTKRINEWGNGGLLK